MKSQKALWIWRNSAQSRSVWCIIGIVGTLVQYMFWPLQQYRRISSRHADWSMGRYSWVGRLLNRPYCWTGQNIHASVESRYGWQRVWWTNAGLQFLYPRLPTKDYVQWGGKSLCTILYTSQCISMHDSDSKSAEWPNQQTNVLHHVSQVCTVHRLLPSHCILYYQSDPKESILFTMICRCMLLLWRNRTRVIRRLHG